VLARITKALFIAHTLYSGCLRQSLTKSVKIATPLSYIFQAAMGQCSTLPAETKQAPTSSAETAMREQTHRLNEQNGPKQSLDFNALVVEQQRPVKQQQQQQQQHANAARGMSIQPDGGMVAQMREPDRMDATPMNVDSRDDSTPPYVAPLPDNAVRTRCYRLNLESEIGLSSQKPHICLGPFTEPPPYLTYSSSEDSVDVSPTKVAIQTAQIFRGITVSRDGTILTQNARATRSNRGNNKTKRGEKSRQAAKIDKAHDLVEESAMACSEHGEESKLVSLVIVGDYDDMKYLVRDGSRKLREAEGLPDEALLSINRYRSSAIQKQQPKTPSSTRSRRRSSLASSLQSGPTTPVTSPKSTDNSVVSQSAPPKLKSNPRDTRRGREGLRMRLDTCNDFMVPDASRRGGAAATDDGSDWAHAWNIWNCGGVGTVSPLQPSSPTRVVFEGRDANNYTNREAGTPSRAG